MKLWGDFMNRTNVAGHVTLKNPVQLMAFHNTHFSTGYQQKKLNIGCEGFKKVQGPKIQARIHESIVWKIQLTLNKREQKYKTMKQ